VATRTSYLWRCIVVDVPNTDRASAQAAAPGELARFPASDGGAPYAGITASAHAHLSRKNTKATTSCSRLARSSAADKTPTRRYLISISRGRRACWQNCRDRKSGEHRAQPLGGETAPWTLAIILFHHAGAGGLTCISSTWPWRSQQRRDLVSHYRLSKAFGAPGAMYR